jgi:hypothetical protein
MNSASSYCQPGLSPLAADPAWTPTPSFTRSPMPGPAGSRPTCSPARRGPARRDPDGEHNSLWTRFRRSLEGMYAGIHDVLHRTDETLVIRRDVAEGIRTAGNPFRSQPSPWMLGTVLGVCGLAAVLPFTPVAGALGFEPLQWAFIPFLLAIAASYLGEVELVKRRFFRAIDAR